MALGDLARLLEAKLAQHVARGGIVGEVAGDELIVPNGLGDLDHGATCLCRKAKTPLGPGNPIAQFRFAIEIANAAPTD